jgi:hypothetical protein
MAGNNISGKKKSRWAERAKDRIIGGGENVYPR